MKVFLQGKTRSTVLFHPRLFNSKNVDPCEKHYIRATSSSIFSVTITSKATCSHCVYNALVEQTLHCTLFTNPTWPCISCRCGSLIHNELIMVLLVQDCFPFLPRTHIYGVNLQWRCGSAAEVIAACMKHRLWNVLMPDSSFESS